MFEVVGQLWQPNTVVYCGEATFRVGRAGNCFQHLILRSTPQNYPVAACWIRANGFIESRQPEELRKLQESQVLRGIDISLAKSRRTFTDVQIDGLADSQRKSMWAKRAGLLDTWNLAGIDYMTGF